MNQLGRPASQPSPRRIALHRAFGWVFTAAFLVMFGTMFGRFYAYWEEDPARIVAHYTAAFALLMLLLLKVSIPRYYPGFRKYLFPLGTSVLLLAFLTTASALAHYLVRMTQQTPYISHASISSAPDLELGKQLFIERCRTCHLLDKILKIRTKESWEKIVDSMAKLAWPRIKPDEARQILFYLGETRTARASPTVTGFPILDQRCMVCHEPGEILLKPRTRKEWDEIVIRTAKEAPEILSTDLHIPIVDALMAAQAKSKNAK